MIRNLKVLVIALAAAFAISAMATSIASAQQGKLTVNGGTSVTLDGTESGLNRFAFFGAEVECPGSTMKGHKIGSTTESIPANATEMVLTPTFANCVARDGLGTHKATVTGPCHYVGRIGPTTGGQANTYQLRWSYTCVEPIVVLVIDVYAFAGSELGGVQCTIKIKPQSELTGQHLTVETPADRLRYAGTVVAVHAERSGAGCATETTTTGTQDVNMTINGTNAGGGSTGITVTD